MNRSAQSLLGAVGVAVTVACGSTHSPPSQQGALASDADASAVVDEGCHTSEFREVRRTPNPSGSCKAGASCRFSGLAGREACAAYGGQYVPASPASWECSCPEGTWVCEVKGGGLGLVPCPDAGP